MLVCSHAHGLLLHKMKYRLKLKIIFCLLCMWPGTSISSHLQHSMKRNYVKCVKRLVL